MMRYVLVFTVGALLFGLSDSAPNSCRGIQYRKINDPRRSTGYVSNDTKKYLCDRSLLEDRVWYRFESEAGDELPTTKPKHGTCGTFAPIWMNGSHPTISDGTVARKACANVPHAHPFGCAYSYDIHVRNCSGYYIYQLKPPQHCILAYCAGSKVFNCSTDSGSCIANRPPYISLPDRFYAFERSKFELHINATDPEGYLIHGYEFLPNKTISDVSIKDEIVRIYLTQSGKVSLRVTDQENAKSSPHTIDIVALPCSCMNEGKCYNKKSVSTNRDDFSNVKCKCAEPYTGRWCEVSPCDSLPCFPEVNCLVTNDGYECGKCPERFEGDGKDCQLILTDDIVVVEAELKIVSGLIWSNSLSNKTSILYKNETAKIVAQIKEAFSGTKEFLSVVVIRYRKGSVVVEFQVVLKEKTNDPLEPLRTHATQNKFGSLKVDLHSIKEENSTEVEGTLNIVSGLEWNDGLSDKDSPLFKTESFNVANEISKIYADEKDFVYVFVTGFRKKKLTVEFKIVWRNESTKHKALEKLRAETKDGALGNLKIAKDSVKEKTPVESSNDDSSYFGLHQAVFITLVCIVSILALIAIIVCGICIRKRHVSIIMLTTNDDRHEFCQNSRNEDIQMKKRPSHNQVVDIHNM